MCFLTDQSHYGNLVLSQRKIVMLVCVCARFFVLFCFFLFFSSKNKKNKVYPCKPQFYYIKLGFKGVNIIYTCFRDEQVHA